MKSTSTVRMLIVAACLLGAAAYLAKASRAETIPQREPLSGLPFQIDDWTGQREDDFSSEVLALLSADDYITRTYYKPDDAAIGLYVGYHASQRQGDAIHSPLNCLPGAGWQPLEQGRTVIDVAYTTGESRTRPIEVNRVVIGKGLDRLLVLYWYQSHRRVVASEYWGKIYTVLDAVRYNRTDAALVRVLSPIRDGASAASAEARVISFIQALFPQLGRHLPT